MTTRLVSQRDHVVSHGVEQAESAAAVTRTLSDFPGFPRAQDSADLLYREMFCVEMRDPMRAWVALRFDSLDTWPMNVSAGAMMIESMASNAIGRRVNANERELIERVVRDLVFAHAVKERARECELAREII